MTQLLDFHKQVLDHLSEAVYFVDIDRQILSWNHAAEILTGFVSNEVVGSRCFNQILNHVDEQMNPLCNSECPLTFAMKENQQIATRAFLHHKQGHRVPVQIKVNPVIDQKGEVIGAVEIFSDATAYLELESLNGELKRLIHIDPLTQIPNRRAFQNLLRQEFSRYHRFGECFSIVFADIDHFKQVNDRHGHQAGDQTLEWFSRQLESGLRKVDQVCRWGGEEFVAILPATDCSQGEIAAEKLCRQLSGQNCPVTGELQTASFGVAEVQAWDTPESLIERADQGLYAAKAEGRNRVKSQYPGKRGNRLSCAWTPDGSSQRVTNREQ